MKKHFMTGLALILPVAITIIIVIFLVNFLTTPFLSLVENIFMYTGLITIDHPLLLEYVSKLIILIFLTAFILLLGVIGHRYLQRHLIEISDYFFLQIPFINRIYKAMRELVHTLLTPNINSFQKVVLVKYPNDQSVSLGLIAQDTLPESSDPGLKDRVTVLVLGTPNPTSGYVLLYKKEDLVYLDMSVKEALKTIVSCGVICSDFKIREKF